MSPASLTKWTQGILGVNEEAKTPEQILDIPGLFRRIHQLQRAVGIDETPIPVLEGSAGGGGDEAPAQRIDDLETALAAALVRIAQLEGHIVALGFSVGSPTFEAPALTINA